MPLWIEPARVGGSIKAPPSKSAMQRAVACAALAEGDSVILNPSFCDDAIAAMGVAEVLGAGVRKLADRVMITGMDIIQHRVGGKDSWKQALSASCGEAGLCLRMYSAIAALLPVPVELQAQGSLRVRPMDMVIDSLKAFGVRCSADGGLPPVRVHGPLHGGRGRVDGARSSQFLTGLLIALACADGDSIVEVTNLASKGYVDLTLDIMKHFGAEVSRDDGLTRFSVGGGKGYLGREYFVEGDWSGAAFLLVAGATAGPATGSGLRVEGLSAQSSQPDRAILEALVLAGARLGMGRNAITVGRSALRGFSFDATDCPDLFPPLVALCLRCHGGSRIRGVARLRDKESDRAEALVTEFGRLGLSIRIDGDELVIPGVENLPGGALPGGLVLSRGDHRIAMAAAVAGLCAGGRVGIEGEDCVAKSYPGFYEDLAKLASQFG
ncbi:MAG: 3-phosphoshikimate 1-carboxyvinyltransferase [Spirochaetota bacterium]